MGSFAMHRFRAIDRPLTREEMAEIDSWSSRHSPTSTGVTYIYHYGSFKKDETSAVAKFFDAMLYVNNWGQVQLMFRFPKKLVDWKELTKYAIISDSYLDFKRIGDYVIMDLNFSDESGDWIMEDDYLLDSLLSLREEILNGDYRTLFLGWLMVRQQMHVWEGDDLEEEEFEDFDDEFDDSAKHRMTPPVPSNLKRLNAAHKELINYFQIREDYIKAAAKASSNSKKEAVNYADLIAKLSSNEKDDLLLKLISGEKHLAMTLKKKLDLLQGKTGISIKENTVLWKKIVENA